MAAEYRPDIDGLRAVAVGAVVLYHLHPAALPGGYVGVDVFFVLSGYLIFRNSWAQLERGAFSLADFYARRALRLLPASLAVLVAVLAWGWWRLLPSDLARLGAHAAATTLYGANLWSWRHTGYFDAAAETQPLLHAWSLSVEEQFYLAAPVVLLGVHRYARRHAVALLAVVAVGTLVASEWMLDDHRTAAFFLAPLRAWEFLIGALAALLPNVPDRHRTARWAAVLPWIAAVGIVTPMVTLSPASAFPGLAALPACLGAAVLVRADLRGGPLRAILSLRPMVTAGTWSYALYLWHWPVFVLWDATRAGEPADDAAALLGKLALALALAVGSYRFVETPLRRPTARGAVLVGVVLTSLSVTATGVWLARVDGAPWRFPDEVLALDAARTPWKEVGEDGEVSAARFAGCIGPTAPVDGACRLGRPEGEADVAVWGDSHAAALAPGLDAALARVGRAGWLVASSACPPVFGVRSTGVRGQDWQCERASARMERLLATGGVRSVVLVGYWDAYLDDDSTVRLSDAEGADGNARVLGEALAASVARLRSAGADVTIVETPPRYRRDVAHELGLARAHGRVPALALDLTAVRAAHAPFRALLRGAAPDAHIVDLPAVYCPTGGACIHADAMGQPLYWDAHHLRPNGALRAVDVLVVALGADATGARHDAARPLRLPRAPSSRAPRSSP
jgi:peptidoglycan/LPS O-acetylase OafA/YrhL